MHIPFLYSLFVDDRDGYILFCSHCIGASAIPSFPIIQRSAGLSITKHPRRWGVNDDGGRLPSGESGLPGCIQESIPCLLGAVGCKGSLQFPFPFEGIVFSYQISIDV